MFDAIAPLTPGAGTRTLTPEEREEVEWILDAAAEWQAGRLPWQEVARIGGIELGGYPSAAYTRFCAVAFTPPTDPRRVALLALIDVLIRNSGYKTTYQGTYSPSELRQHDIAVQWVRQDEKGNAA